VYYKLCINNMHIPWSITRCYLHVWLSKFVWWSVLFSENDTSFITNTCTL